MIVAHDPGLGKTTTAIAFAELHPMRAVPEHYAGKIKRIAVVCPERARTMWADTFHEWTNRKAFRYGVDNSAGKDWSETDDGVLIVGYASIIREGFVHRLGHAPFDGSLLIVDDAGQFLLAVRHPVCRRAQDQVRLGCLGREQSPRAYRPARPAHA
jgi:hypothetical protein